MNHPLPPLAGDLQRAIENRTAHVAILGLGYAGLPLVDVFLKAGFPVLGFDIASDKVDHLQRGVSYIRHISSDTIGSFLTTGRFTATSHAEHLAGVDICLICVPTPLTASREPDLSAVHEATRAITASLRPGQLVILTSTTYPGTTRELRAILEAKGLYAGRDLFLAYSPEREDPGNLQHTTTSIPRLVGGVDPLSGHLASTFFATALDNVIAVSSAEVAEGAKILENTYRAVNIALVNELKVLYDRMGIDIWEVIEAARSKPFGFQAFYPGPGWGGHCIPIDPFYLAWLGRKHACPVRFVELAGEINTAMSLFVAAKVADALNEQGKPLKGSKLGLLGMAYKPDLDDVRESPGLELLDLFWQKGAVVSYHDPYVPQVKVQRRSELELSSQALTGEWLQEQDCVIVVTHHSVYDWQWIVDHAHLVVDTRNATCGVTRHRERIRKA